MYTLYPIVYINCILTDWITFQQEHYSRENLTLGIWNKEIC